MTRLGALLATGALFSATPAFAQTVGNCAHGGGANQPQAVWVLCDLGSAQVLGDNKNKIAEAAVTAKARQVTSICVIGHTEAGRQGIERAAGARAPRPSPPSWSVPASRPRISPLPPVQSRGLRQLEPGQSRCPG